MSTVWYLIGDIREQADLIADGSCDLVFTSSPFLALRAYLAADHPDKAKEIGAEPTPGAFIDTLLDVVDVLAPKLAPHGSIMWELGDTSSGSGGGGGDYLPGGLREDQPGFGGSAAAAREGNAAHWRAKNAWKADAGLASKGGRTCRPADVAAGIAAPTNRPGPAGRDLIPGWPLDKSLCMVPELFRVALAYGFNPLTGRVCERWRVRNVVRWARNNPPVGSLGKRNVEMGTGDGKYRPATSDLVVICRDRHRYFDLDAVRPAPVHGFDWRPGSTSGHAPDVCPVNGGDASHPNHSHSTNPAGAPPLDHWWHDDDWFDQDAWLVNTRGYKGAHYATMPPELAEIPIKSMCPEHVCRKCGRPRERITSTQRMRTADGTLNPPRVPPTRDDASNGTTAIGVRHAVTSTSTTLGWTECGCGDGCRPTSWVTVETPEMDDDGEPTGRTVKARKVADVGECADPSHWRRGVVLDPFGGAGTTAVTATKLGRDCVLVDLDDRNLALTTARLDAIADPHPDGGWTLTPRQADLFAAPTPPPPVPVQEALVIPLPAPVTRYAGGRPTLTTPATGGAL